MTTTQNLTPAAKKLLVKAAANGGTYARPTYGPMTQLVEAGLATMEGQALELTFAGRFEADLLNEAK